LSRQTRRTQNGDDMLRESGTMPRMSDIIVKDPEILGGTPVFRGTRVPVQTMVDCLEGGATPEDFLEGFPAVTREMAVSALEQARELLSAQA
jgi:uncharacterized protein (DUF433 family)